MNRTPGASPSEREKTCLRRVSQHQSSLSESSGRLDPTMNPLLIC